jgi:hypothetical protein
MKYRKRPVVIEAVKHVGGNHPAVDFITDDSYYFKECELYIKTPEGVHHVSVGDYIIRGVKGEYYAYKPDIFEMTYEKVDESESAP